LCHITCYQKTTVKAGTKKPDKGFVKDIEKATQKPPMVSMFPEDEAPAFLAPHHSALKCNQQKGTKNPGTPPHARRYIIVSA